MSSDPRAKAFKEATEPKSVKLPPENNNASLNDIKRSLKQKERMRRRQFYLCDACDQAIYQPEDGYVIHGNVYVADPNGRGGLIGNNFPEVQPGDKIEVTDVQETVYCKRCFIEAIGLYDPVVGSTDINTESLRQDGDFKGILKNLGVTEKRKARNNKGTASLDTDDFFGELRDLENR